MKKQLWVRQEFESSHSPRGAFPPAYPCAMPHRYMVTLTLTSWLGDDDIPADYHDLNRGFADILARFGDAMPSPATCESIARDIFNCAYRLWPSVSSVEVQEQLNVGCRVLKNTESVDNTSQSKC